jgi:ADP-ribosylglycohydrolase
VTTSDHLRGAIYGHLIGDALGVPYEFGHHIETVEWRGHGTHNQPPGTWSDDGALMLATLDSLLETGFDPADQARRFLKWRHRGAYTPDGDGLFDIGGATRRALHRLRAGVPPEEAGNDPEALGNGSLMRILPIALVDPAETTTQLVSRAHRSSTITHGAPACQVACALYVLIARELRDGEQDRPLARGRATELLRAEYGRLRNPSLTDALDALLRWPGRSGRGHVSDSIWSAWDAFVDADGYRSTVTRAVRYGNDTDTTAAIAGGLAGLYFGETDIPADWRRDLRGQDIVEPLVTRLLRRFSGQPDRERPLLLVDVDGVLNPYAPPDGESADGYEERHVGAQRVLLSRRHGHWLRDLARHFELVWATTWAEEANQIIGPAIGLAPDLPVIAFSERTPDDWTWKLPAVERFVGNRAVAWLDDDPGPGAEEWAESRTSATLLVRPDGRVGWSEDDYGQLLAFANSLKGG